MLKNLVFLVLLSMLFGLAGCNKSQSGEESAEATRPVSEASADGSVLPFPEPAKLQVPMGNRFLKVSTNAGKRLTIYRPMPQIS